MSLRTCTGRIAKSDLQTCYNLTTEQSDHLTDNSKWDIQNNVVNTLDFNNNAIVINDSDIGSNVCIGNNVVCDSRDTCTTPCLSKSQWLNLKLLKSFTQNYQEWKKQENEKIQNSIQQYSQSLNQVMTNVNSMVTHLDKIEAQTGNEVKQDHMIKEMTDMLSTYDRKLEVDQADQEELDLKINSAIRTLNIILIGIVLACVLIYYIYRKKRSAS